MKFIYIYIILGIISRVVFFIVQKRLYKKYDIKDNYVPFNPIVELIAHAMDVVGWPFATVASFYLLNKEIKESKND